jgi:hypothetical protein
LKSEDTLEGVKNLNLQDQRILVFIGLLGSRDEGTVMLRNIGDDCPNSSAMSQKTACFNYTVVKTQNIRVVLCFLICVGGQA